MRRKSSLGITISCLSSFSFPQARRSETVLSVKKRALDQLEVWCRFTDVCNERIDLSSRSVRFFGSSVLPSLAT